MIQIQLAMLALPPQPVYRLTATLEAEDTIGPVYAFALRSFPEESLGLVDFHDVSFAQRIKSQQSISTSQKAALGRLGNIQRNHGLASMAMLPELSYYCIKRQPRT